MKSIRGCLAASLAIVLVVGSTALPSRSSRNHSRSVGKSEETTPFFFGGNQPRISTIASNGSNGDTENVDDGVTKSFRPAGISVTIGSGATVSPASLSSSTGTMSTDRDSLVDRMEQSSTISSMISSISSIVDARTELGTTTAGNRGSNATTGTSSTDGAAPTTTNASSNSNSGTSAAPTEAFSRTIVSGQDTDAFPSTSRKSTTSFNEFTTTPASISPKETRESPGKIRPQIKLTTNYSGLVETGVRLPEGASAALAKPTKYHYYPHNQHIYLLPECAVQQVCNAVYVRLNFTQPLCACPGRYRDPCSASLDSDDLHTTELVTDPRTKALTLVKTCEPVAEMRECRTPRDWSLLALQNVRTGKSHYLVICRCPDANILEGPMSHDQPTYASVPGIRVYGMMCVQGNRRGRPLRYTRSVSDYVQQEIGDGRDAYNRKEERNERLSFPWNKVQQLMNTIVWD